MRSHMTLSHNDANISGQKIAKPAIVGHATTLQGYFLTLFSLFQGLLI